MARNSAGTDRRPEPDVDDLTITRRGDYVEVGFTGEFSATVAMRVVDLMVGECLEAECSNILLDCRRMRGTMSVVDRYEVAGHGATVIPPSLKVAVLGREDQILPDRFFENVAVNRGVQVQVFTRKEDAIGWLCPRA